MSQGEDTDFVGPSFVSHQEQRSRACVPSVWISKVQTHQREGRDSVSALQRERRAAWAGPPDGESSAARALPPTSRDWTAQAARGLSHGLRSKGSGAWGFYTACHYWPDPFRLRSPEARGCWPWRPSASPPTSAGPLGMNRTARLFPRDLGRSTLLGPAQAPKAALGPSCMRLAWSQMAWEEVPSGLQQGLSPLPPGPLSLPPGLARIPWPWVLSPYPVPRGSVWARPCRGPRSRPEMGGPRASPPHGWQG